MSILALAAGSLLGIPIGVFRAMTPLWLRAPVSATLSVIRSIPLLLLVFWIFLFVQVVLAIPLDPIWVGCIALGLYAMTHISDIVRAGAKAVPKEQIRTAQSLGLSQIQIAMHVIIPISVRVMIPALTSFCTTLFKDSAVVYVIGVIEIMQLGLLESTRDPQNLLYYYALVAAVFFTVNTLGTRLAFKLEQRVKIQGTLS